MSLAYICSRCREYCDGSPSYTLESKCYDKFELCPKCRDKFKAFIIEREPKDAHG